MEEKNGGNGTSTHLRLVRPPTATCPACGSKIPHEKFEEILCLTEARDLALARERALLEEREARVDDAVRGAVESERAKWSAVAAEVTEQVDQLKATHAAALEKVAAAHEERIQAEVRRRTATMEKLERDRETFRRTAERERQAKETMMRRFVEKQQRERVAVEARANAAADRRIKAAEVRLRAERRAAVEEHQDVVAALRKELKTIEGRRDREATAMKRQIAQLSRRAEGRDRAHFGIEGEDDLASLLRIAFREDKIEVHGRGGDVVHRVIDSNRQVGVVVYENKNTATYQNKYVDQTVKAMNKHNTVFGLLCTRALPARTSVVSMKSGVVIVTPAVVIPVATIMRDAIVAIARTRASADGKKSKAAALLSYLGSTEFSGSMRRCDTTTATLQRSLDSEKASHAIAWAQREAAHAALRHETAAINARVNELLLENKKEAS